MTQQDVPTISHSVEIDAPVAKVWSLVSDPRHMTRWSPQTWKTFLRGGGQLGEGARFFNINKRGLLVWPTQSKIVRFTPEQEVAWRVKDNYTIWSLKLTPNATGGTTLLQSREAPQGLSNISVTLTKRFFGGLDDFAAELQRDMGTTLAKIKAEAER